MAVYSVVSKPSVEKDLRRLPRSVAPRILARIASLADTPLPRDAVPISGAERLYRLRVGDYRVIYEVNGALREVVVHYVRHRKVAYRGL